MKKLTPSLSVVIVCVLALAANAQSASNKTVGAQEISGSVQVSKAPKAVWAMLTESTLPAKTLGFVHEKGSKTFAKVGDWAWVTFHDWNDSGALVVTYAKSEKELRMSFDPENGSYLCQDRFELSPAGKGTKVTLTQTYTESGPQSEADIRKQVAQWEAKLAKLKTRLETGK